MDFALQVEKLRNYSAEKKHYLAYSLVSISSYLNLLIQLIAFATNGYHICQVAWVTFVSAVAALAAAVASLIVIQGVPRWMQWLIFFMAQILVGITGFGACTGCDMTMSAYVHSWMMLTVFQISEPGLKRYFQLEDEKKVALSVIEYNILKNEIVLKDCKEDKHHVD